ncbi:hypothetical protein ACQ4PT_068167 [Festuca glaucescens]
MRIRRCASRLLGSAASSASAPALPPSSLPAVHDAGFVAPSGTTPSSLVPCELSLSPWDLMDQLHLSDPQEEETFFETYLVAVAWQASWLFQPSMPATGSIKEEEHKQEDMAVDAVDGVIFELQVCKKNAVRKKKVVKVKPNMNKEKIEAEKSDATAGGERPLWTCKKNVNGGKRWSCWRPVSQPNSFCSYHSDQKLKRKRATDVGEGFYYYTGFGPSRSKRLRISNSSAAVPAEPQPAGQKEEAPPKEEIMHIDSSAGQAQADEPMSNDGTAGNEESSDDDVVKFRSLKSLMYS